MTKTETTQRAIAAYNRARQSESEAEALRLAIERQGGETTDALARAGCESWAPDKPVWCTLKDGHSGSHKAKYGSLTVATWKEEPVTRYHGSTVDFE